MMMERIIKPPEKVGKMFCCEGLRRVSKKDSCEGQQFSNFQQQRSQIPDRFLLAHRKQSKNQQQLEDKSRRTQVGKQALCLQLWGQRRKNRFSYALKSKTAKQLVVPLEGVIEPNILLSPLQEKANNAQCPAICQRAPCIRQLYKQVPAAGWPGLCHIDFTHLEPQGHLTAQQRSCSPKEQEKLLKDLGMVWYLSQKEAAGNLGEQLSCACDWGGDIL